MPKESYQTTPEELRIICKGMTWEQALALKEEIERDQQAQVYALERAKPIFYGLWVVDVVYIYKNWRKQKCHSRGRIFFPEEWPAFYERLKQHAAEAMQPGARESIGKKERATGYYHPGDRP